MISATTSSSLPTAASAVPRSARAAGKSGLDAIPFLRYGIAFSKRDGGPRSRQAKLALLVVRLKLKDLPQHLLVFQVLPVKGCKPQKRSGARGFELRRSLIMRNTQLPLLLLAVDITGQNVTLGTSLYSASRRAGMWPRKVACCLGLRVCGSRALRISDQHGAPLQKRPGIGRRDRPSTQESCRGSKAALFLEISRALGVLPLPSPWHRFGDFARPP